jgi:MFS family permease
MAITFIVIIVILIFSIKYIDKIALKPVISFFIILIGFCSIYISFNITVEWLLLYYFLMGLSIAYLTPVLLKVTTDKMKTKTPKDYYKHSFTAGIIVWLFVSAILFNGLGVYYPTSSWRFLYLIMGIINIASSPLISLL